jgi:menaquinol-cytochrome c reductase iron-sulfur subunit
MSKKFANAQPSPETTTEEKGIKPAFPERNATRRDFLKVSVATGIVGCAVGAPICAAVRLVTAPVFAEGTGGKLYPLTSFDSLTEQPKKFFIVDDKTDAWTTLPQQKIGSLFLRKVGKTVQAFHSLCPHAGCMIQLGHRENPQTKVEQELFYCPCHGACFDLDGKRLNTVPPRDMDSLEVEVKDGQVYVKFENYTFGIADKRAT